MPKINLNDTEYSEGRYPKELMQYYQGNTDTYKQIKVRGFRRVNSIWSK